MKKTAEPVKTSKPEMMDENERKLYEKALAVQEEMRIAPEKFVSEDTPDQFENLAKIYAPETIDKRDKSGKIIKRAERSSYFGDPNEESSDVARGYVPVINEKGYIVRGPGNMPLYTIDRKLRDARETLHQKESQKRLKTVLDIGKVATKGAEGMQMPSDEDRTGARYDGEVKIEPTGEQE